jgi:hypothetical protein
MKEYAYSELKAGFTTLHLSTYMLLQQKKNSLLKGSFKKIWKTI